jgi:hypothetical protein
MLSFFLVCCCENIPSNSATFYKYKAGISETLRKNTPEASSLLQGLLVCCFLRNLAYDRRRVWLRYEKMDTGRFKLSRRFISFPIRYTVFRLVLRARAFCIVFAFGGQPGNRRAV